VIARHDKKVSSAATPALLISPATVLVILAFRFYALGWK